MKSYARLQMQNCHTEHDQVLQRKLSIACAQAKPSLLYVTSSLSSNDIKNTARSAGLNTLSSIGTNQERPKGVAEVEGEVMAPDGSGSRKKRSL